MLFSKILTSLSLCFFLTACGFQPLYRSPHEISDICYPIKIATIFDRNGQILRNYLIDLLTPEGQPPYPEYILEVKLTDTVMGTGVNRNELTSRKEARLTAAFVLRDSQTNKIVYKHTAQAINSFTVLSQNYYSDVIAENYAKKEAARLLAEKMRLLISAYLDKLYEN